MKVISVNSKKLGIKEIFVDDEDYEKVMVHKWFVQKNKKNFYAVRWRPLKERDESKRSVIQMHRFILDMWDKDTYPDHIDHNGLNNQKFNLRPSTHKQNTQNKSKSRGKSKYLGVSLKHYRLKKQGWKYWVATVKTDGKNKTKQFPFTTEGEMLAAKTYDQMATKYFGEFANLNFKEK